jgi:hypothetical protein
MAPFLDLREPIDLKWRRQTLQIRGDKCFCLRTRTMPISLMNRWFKRARLSLAAIPPGAMARL